MNQFHLDLAVARKRQAFFYLIGAIFLIACALTLVAYLAFMRGVAIDVQPAEAAETAEIQVSGGAGLALMGKVYAFTGTPEVTVQAPGFKPEKRYLKDSEMGGTAAFLLAELPAILTAATLPPNDKTQWLLDGRKIAVGAKLETEIAAGTYSLGINDPYRQKHEQKVVLSRGERADLSISLKALSGSLNIASEPEGVPVILGGQQVGVTPLKIDRPGGRYEVVLDSSLHKQVSDTIEIRNDALHPSRNYKLENRKAQLSVSAKPAGGTLFVNGHRMVGQGPHEVEANVETTVSYIRAGYFDETQRFTLAPGEERDLSIALKPQKGRMEIRTRPVAEAFIDNKRVGKTPVTVNLLSVPHKIELKKPGYRTVVKRLTPSHKKPMLVDVRLIPELQARLAEAPKEYKNSAGISLKLFQPKNLKMGAPRHQRGQRANEFERNVTFSKPYYAGLREVSVREFSKFRKVGGAPDEPVVSVSWADAARYCNWLSSREGLAPFYQLDGDDLKGFNPSSEGYRLLTEAEWEWLARKGGEKASTVFPWGDEPVVPPGAGNIADESSRGTVPVYVPNYTDGFTRVAPVGKFLPEKSGLYDLTGNVTEWVHDFYSLTPPKNGAIESDPLGPSYGTLHTVKGSSFRSGSRTELRAAYREAGGNPRDDLGFRVGRYLYGGVDGQKK